jgi:hypothetical protein
VHSQVQVFDVLSGYGDGDVAEQQGLLHRAATGSTW